MEEIVKSVLDRLDELAIPYELLHHEPAAHMEDCRAVEEAMGAVMPRNLFLTTRRQGGYWLCLMRPDAPFKSGEVSRQAGSSRLCFSEESPLYELLHVRPGSVTPLALMFDKDKKVAFLMDRSLKDEERLLFHPCLNTYSVSIRTEDFLNVFLPAAGHEPVWIDVES